MDGAGARYRTVIGGRGGSSNSISGNASLANSNSVDGWKQWGEDGYQGEDCGIISINDSVTVYAYGGSGSKTVPSMNWGTNSGGSGYPAAGIGRWSEPGRSWWRLGKWCRRICRNLGR